MNAVSLSFELRFNAEPLIQAIQKDGDYSSLDTN